MEPTLIAIITAAVGAGVGFALGRASGRSSGVSEGRRLGLEDGRRAGREEGQKGGAERGRAEGLEEGRRLGLSTGREEGRTSGLAEGKAAGLAEGKAAGLSEAREASEARFQALIDALKRGRLPEGGADGSVEGQLRLALEAGWAPREAEREAALREAIGRVSAFLTSAVRAPLAGIEEGAESEELSERIERALGALQDLDFFISEIDPARHGTDLGKLAQGVAREFAADHEIAVRLMLESPVVRAEVNSAALMDALYLILHNAGRFGDGGTIDLTVGEDAGRAVLRVRDRGEGFTEEAFTRAFDPFYSTSDEGLGLGLPHARKVIEGMGGHIELRNVPDGGAEVEISFPVG